MATELDDRTTPDAEFASEIAMRVRGAVPVSVRRFTTGAQHYVFEVGFADQPPMVARIGDPSARGKIAGALELSRLLRPLGAPLPAVLGEDLDGRFPWMALERLPGTDLGDVIADLPSDRLARVAAEVARAQAIVTKIGSAGRYGYAVRPDQAPCASWFEVLEQNLARSRERIQAAGLFDPALVDAARAKLAAARTAIGRIAPTPFLHDTTTKNVIVTPEGAFSGIVDVDELCFGDPRYPAALTAAALAASGDPRTDYVDAWLRHAKQPDDGVFQLYVGVFLLDLMGEHGHVFNGNDRPSRPAARERLRQALEARLAMIR